MAKGKKKAAKNSPSQDGGGKKNGKQKKPQFSMMEEARHTERGYDGKLSNRRLEKRTMAFVSAGSTFDQAIEDAARQKPIVGSISRNSSPSSVSSEELILFTGRNKPARSMQASNGTIRDLNSSTSQLHLNPKNNNQTKSKSSKAPATKRTFSSSRPLQLSSDDDIDQEMIADYIANMDSSSSDSERDIKDEDPLPAKGKQAARFSHSNGHTEVNPIYKLIAEQIAEAKISSSASQTTENGSGSLPYNIRETQTIRIPLAESAVQPSSSKKTAPSQPRSKALETGRRITSILSQRNGDVGIYFLVVYDNQDDDTAEWVQSDGLINMSSEALQFFESPMWETDDSESVDSEIQAEKDLADMFNDELFEDEQLRKKQTRMTDEEIAIRLAKQQEFGIDASEVVMFDGGESPGESIEYLRREAVRFSQKTTKVFAHVDSDDSDFDLMDHERPSLQKQKKKGKKPKFGVLDSEMEQDMLATWDADRAKKKKRKQEREELRAQGLLGGGAKAKYANGMALDELKEELRDFLAAVDKSTLTLPPMDKKERKLVHEIAHAFNVTSTSRGTGATRHPTLHKKMRSRPFSDQAFDGIADRLLRRFGVGGPAKVKRDKQNKAFGYKEGDVVGSNAPELGSENRGRQMLEKMGWATGDALGALNNPGILNPITHVVRSSKAGLG